MNTCIYSASLINCSYPKSKLKQRQSSQWSQRVSVVVEWCSNVTRMFPAAPRQLLYTSYSIIEHAHSRSFMNTKLYLRRSDLRQCRGICQLPSSIRRQETSFGQQPSHRIPAVRRPSSRTKWSWKKQMKKRIISLYGLHKCRTDLFNGTCWNILKKFLNSGSSKPASLLSCILSRSAFTYNESNQYELKCISPELPCCIKNYHTKESPIIGTKLVRWDARICEIYVLPQVTSL